MSSIPLSAIGGLNQSTLAAQMAAVAALGRPASANRKRPTRKRVRAAAKPRRAASTRKRVGPVSRKKAHLVKGSAAARRHMAKLRRMRRRR